MTKSDFLDELKLALSGRVSAQEVTEHLRFYEDYINTQMRMGKREEDILEELGEPRLLARNIAESKKYAADGSRKNSEETNNTKTTGDNGYADAYNRRVKRVKMPTWIWVVLIIVVLVVFLALCFSILSFLAPVLIPLLLILLWARFLLKKS